MPCSASIDNVCLLCQHLNRHAAMRSVLWPAVQHSVVNPQHAWHSYCQQQQGNRMVYMQTVCCVPVCLVAGSLQHLLCESLLAIAAPAHAAAAARWAAGQTQVWMPPNDQHMAAARQGLLQSQSVLSGSHPVLLLPDPSASTISWPPGTDALVGVLCVLCSSSWTGAAKGGLCARLRAFMSN